ncbi:MAG: alkaline phosphatase [Verrucomicrobiota bacterium]|jgi:predicted AlkP superfamily pyrophosphatase or phosphodiesterase|nr:alkaline phosphatase [Verrucomicrobiota bacterium]
MHTHKHLLAPLFLSAACALSAALLNGAEPVPAARHVILIGIDGFGAYAWEKAEIPNLKALAARGALSLKTRAVMPTVSAPNWATHLKGAGPELHGFTSNSQKPTPPPRVLNAYGTFPGIFGVVRDARPEAELGVIYDWKTISVLFEGKAVNLDQYVAPEGPSDTEEQKVARFERSTAEVARLASDYIRTKKPVLAFVYLGSVDETGHAAGHDTPAYYTSLTRTDAGVGQLLDAAKAAGIEQETAWIVVADHGGINKGHGGTSKLEFETPWLIAGPGIRKGHTIDAPVTHTDTSPTIARLLGLEAPAVWRGRPVLDAFEAK